MYFFIRSSGFGGFQVLIFVGLQIFLRKATELNFRVRKHVKEPMLYLSHFRDDG